MWTWNDLYNTTHARRPHSNSRSRSRSRTRPPMPASPNIGAIPTGQTYLDASYDGTHRSRRHSSSSAQAYPHPGGYVSPRPATPSGYGLARPPSAPPFATPFAPIGGASPYVDQGREGRRTHREHKPNKLRKPSQSPNRPVDVTSHGQGHHHHHHHHSHTHAQTRPTKPTNYSSRPAKPPKESRPHRHSHSHSPRPGHHTHTHHHHSNTHHHRPHTPTYLTGATYLPAAAQPTGGLAPFPFQVPAHPRPTTPTRPTRPARPHKHAHGQGHGHGRISQSHSHPNLNGGAVAPGMPVVGSAYDYAGTPMMVAPGLGAMPMSAGMSPGTSMRPAQAPAMAGLPHVPSAASLVSMPEPDIYDAPDGDQPFEPLMKSFGGEVNEGTSQLMRKSTFRYSKCNGRKKAVCIGINYRGQENQLHGCINDAKSVREFLCRYYGFSKRNIVLLTDDGASSRQLPTRRNMIDAMKWLVKDARMDDSLMFHYSGHGGQIKDVDGDEDDGFDEIIFPLDHKKAGHIVDDEMFAIMAAKLPRGCRLTAIFDSCHSGSALDLPITYTSEGKVKGKSEIKCKVGPSLLAADVRRLAERFQRLQLRDQQKGLARGTTTRTAKRLRMRMSSADIISWSGCKDSQTSADTYQAGQPVGAMSHAFIRALKENPNQSYRQLLNNIRSTLKRRYSQIPQLSSSHPIDTNIKFKM